MKNSIFGNFMASIGYIDANAAAVDLRLLMDVTLNSTILLTGKKIAL